MEKNRNQQTHLYFKNSKLELISLNCGRCGNILYGVFLYFCVLNILNSLLGLTHIFCVSISIKLK